MSKWGCRIGNVRPKVGGAVVRAINPRSNQEIADISQSLKKLPGEVQSEFPEGAIGYVMLVWSGAGMSKVYFHYGLSSPIPFRLLPAYAHDRILEEVCGSSAREIANRVIDERFSK